MADNWLGPDTCGVKLVQFEQMAQDMTRAVSQLEDLADQLWQALNGAKVDTAPAMEIKRLATWAHEAATDLRRRNTLAHDLDRQKLAIEVCRLDGTYLTLPDRYTDQVAYGEGSRLAGLVRRAAAGDRKALADLRRYDPKDVTPALAKALVRTLGADGLLRLPVDLSRRLTVDVHQEGGDAVARDTRNVLAILGRSLALTTDPGRSGYVGDAFFTQIMAAGRTTFPPGTEPPRGAAGYQSLSTLMTAAGNARFSARFMGTVGADMVDYDRHLPKNLGPLPELSGHYDLGNALDPSTTKVTVGDRGTDFLLPLLHAAAASGREGAQALLSHAPMGPHPARTPASGRNSNLAYLLSSRRELWAKTDHGAALGATLKTAASGTDKDSERLAFEAARILATDARKYWVIKEGKLSAVDESGGGNLLKGTFSLSNPKEAMAAYSRVSNPIQDIDAISALRPYMAEVLATHMAKVNDVFRTSSIGRAGSVPMTDVDMDYLLLDLTRDTKSFEILLRGQIAYTAVVLDQAVANGSRHLPSVVVTPGRVFGHILEARSQATEGEKARLAEELARVQSYVGLFTSLAVQKAQAAVASRAPVAGEAANLLVPQTQQALEKMIAKRLTEKPNKAILTTGTNTEAVEKLFSQMIASALITHGRYDRQDLKGKNFATTGDSPEILPLEKLDSHQLEALLSWASENSDIEDLGGRAVTEMDTGKKATAGHYTDSQGNQANPLLEK